MRKQHHIVLTPGQRAEAEAVLARGTHAALTVRHARILLEADERPERRRRTDAQVGDRCGVSARTVARVREAYATAGFAVALHGQPHPGAARTLSVEQEVRLLALACSPPPAGHAQWSVRLLAERIVELAAMPPLSRELVRTTLKKTASNRGGCGDG
ncbi:MAG TPA: helix-turn-helix domain-containing protein [Gemmatimonadales bacterium]|nr:helix-turn-helix domain-containing protein [Gemmatimonadales bacterium]